VKHPRIIVVNQIIIVDDRHHLMTDEATVIVADPDLHLHMIEDQAICLPVLLQNITVVADLGLLLDMADLAAH
jgi:hypothetical protein